MAALAAVVSGTGRLVVVAGVAGAEVSLDGKPVGRTPFDEVVAAGPHVLRVSLAGYRTEERPVEVAPGRATSVAIALPRLPPVRRVGLTFGVAAGVESARAPRRVTAWCGLRDPLDRWEVNGVVSGDHGVRVGLEARVYLLTGRVRPFFRGAALLPWLSLQGGAGVGVGRFDLRSGRDFFLFLELDGPAVTGQLGVMARL